MTQVNVSVMIARPPEDVFAFISDFSKNALWQSGVQKAWFTSDGPLREGSTYTQLSRFLGRDIEFNFRIIRYEPGRLVEFETVSGTFPVHIIRQVEPVPAGTRVTAIIEGDAGGVFKLFAPLLDFMTKRQIQGDYKRLKALLEANTK